MSPKAQANLGGDINWLQLIEKAANTFRKALESPHVREFVRQMMVRAPEVAANWASDFVQWAKARDFRIPRDHFGQPGLERRVRVLREGIAAIFATGDEPGHSELMAAIDQIEVALAFAGQLGFAKRKRAHFKIDRILDDMERALLDAVLPKPPEAQS